MKECWVTTDDNPNDFFKEFQDWYNFDTQKGYGTCSYVMRIALLKGFSTEMNEEEQNEIINEAVNEIVRLNLNGKYRKVYGEELKPEGSEDKDTPPK